MEKTKILTNEILLSKGLKFSLSKVIRYSVEKLPLSSKNVLVRENESDRDYR